MKSKILTIGVSVIIWIISLINQSGFGDAHNTPSKTSLILIFLGTVISLNEFRKKQYINIKTLLIIFTLSSVFILSSNLQGYRHDGLKYLSVFLLVYIVSNLQIDILQLKIISIIYGLLGIGILYIFNYKSVLSGWNPNAIAMMGLFSYLVYMISHINNNLKSKAIFLLVSTLYIRLMDITESRGSTFIILLSICIVCNFIPIKKMYKSDIGITLLLMIPLIVSISVINLSKSHYVNELNEWSIEEFDKPLFNGRDEIWIDGFDEISQNVLFGSGYINSGYWHNSAISCLSSYGVVGYTLWIMVLKAILCNGRKYSEDNFVIGCIASFLLIFIQQSFELGLFSLGMNLVPYFILGLLLGRIKGLKGKCDYDKAISQCDSTNF